MPIADGKTQLSYRQIQLHVRQKPSKLQRSVHGLITVAVGQTSRKCYFPLIIGAMTRPWTSCPRGQVRRFQNKAVCRLVYPYNTSLNDKLVGTSSVATLALGNESSALKANPPQDTYSATHSSQGLSNPCTATSSIAGAPPIAHLSGLHASQANATPIYMSVDVRVSSSPEILSRASAARAGKYIISYNIAGVDLQPVAGVDIQSVNRELAKMLIESFK